MHALNLEAYLPAANSDQTQGSLNYKNSQKVEFSSVRIKLVVLIGVRVGEKKGTENSQELPCLCDYNQLRGLVFLFHYTREERVNLTPPPQSNTPAGNVTLAFQTFFSFNYFSY